MHKTVHSQISRSLMAMVAMTTLTSWLGCSTGVTPDSTVDNNRDSIASAVNVSFSQQVIPILTVQCAGCHSPGGIADLAGIPSHLTADVAFASLVNEPSVQDSALTLVVPGDADTSLLIQKITQDNPPVGLRMPKFAPPLSNEEVNLIRDWINQGAVNN